MPIFRPAARAASITEAIIVRTAGFRSSTMGATSSECRSTPSTSWVRSLEPIEKPPKTREQGLLLDKAGHMMYASHLSYTNDALLGADECDLLVDLVRQREKAGLYGAKITGGGSGGTVAVLSDISPRADAAVDEILDQYARRTGRTPEAFTGTSPGAWSVGTAVIEPS